MDSVTREELLGRLREAEQALRECGDENDASFELARVGRADVIPETGRIVRANKAFCQICVPSRPAATAVSPRRWKRSHASFAKLWRRRRQIAQGLYPPELDDGLFFALRYLSEKVERSFGVACRFIEGKAFPLRESNVRQLYRIAQEAIANSLKHGRATRIAIALVRVRGMVRLTIRDNGVGTPADAGKREGMGLKTMRNPS